jgi:hypothetical protein
MKWILALVTSLVCAGLVEAKNVALPDNVTLRPSGSRSGDYIDTVTLEAKSATFSKLKLCLAQNVSNPALMITGGTDAPFSFYSNNKTQTTAVQGGDIFKYEDANEQVAIVVGSIDGGPAILSRKIIRFELMAVVQEDRTALRFSNIEHATENTGSVTNSGFTPVGAWRGARPHAVIDSLTVLGERVGACLR